jgi:hypothetical protein
MSTINSFQASLGFVNPIELKVELEGSGTHTIKRTNRSIWADTYAIEPELQPEYLPVLKHLLFTKAIFVLDKN